MIAPVLPLPRHGQIERSPPSIRGFNGKYGSSVTWSVRLMAQFLSTIKLLLRNLVITSFYGFRWAGVGRKVEWNWDDLGALGLGANAQGKAFVMRTYHPWRTGR